MKYFVILLIMIGFVGAVFALESKTLDYFSNSDFEIYKINEQRHTFFIPYSITNSKINDITMDCPSRAMVIDIEPAKRDGTLTIVIPRTLLDSRYGPNDDSFFILVDGQETEYSEIEKNLEARIMKIPFSEKSSQIEIIVTTLISQSNDPLKFTPCGEAGSDESSFYKILSPLKQIKSGFAIDEIQCKESLILVIKNNGSPACVKPETKSKLVERGWTHGVDSSSGRLGAIPQVPLKIEELNDIQYVGKKIEFKIKFNGIGYDCGYPTLTIENSKQQKIWESNHIVTLCDPDTKRKHIEKEWHLEENHLGIPILNDTGFYIIRAEFDQTIIQKRFLVQ